MYILAEAASDLIKTKYSLSASTSSGDSDNSSSSTRAWTGVTLALAVVGAAFLW